MSLACSPNGLPYSVHSGIAELSLEVQKKPDIAITYISIDWKIKKRETLMCFFCSPAITKIEMRKVSILLDVVVETFIQHLEMAKVSANVFCKSL